MPSLDTIPVSTPGPSADEVLELIPEAFLVFDADHRVVAANSAALALLDRPRAFVLGASCCELFLGTSGGCAGGSRCPLQQALASVGESGWTVSPGRDGRRIQLRIASHEAASPRGLLGAWLRADPAIVSARDDRPVGRSSAMNSLMEILERVAPTNATVLLLGESGVGKERVADYLHRKSRRAQGPLVVVDCSTLGENLIEAELFGYEKGAFTGADRRKIGLFEAAQGGTLFIDEIGEMPLAMQSKLLRALEASRIRRLGGTEYIDVDARVIAATHRDLASMVRQGSFREDLFYRLSAFPVQIPPLRDRPEDIVALAEYFLLQTENGARLLPLSESVRSLLLQYHYPGNVRELKNIIGRAAILAGEGSLKPEHVAFQSSVVSSQMDSGSVSVRRRGGLSPERIRAVLDACDGHRSEAARRLGISERTLYRHLQKI